MTVPVRFALSGLACFVTALLLPSIQLQLLGKPAIFMGWQVTWWSGVFGAYALPHLLIENSPRDLAYLALGASALSNLSFFILPLILKFWPRRSALLLLGALSIASLVTGLCAPRMLDESHLLALTGYYVWLSGDLFLLLSVVSACRSQTTR